MLIFCLQAKPEFILLFAEGLALPTSRVNFLREELAALHLRNQRLPGPRAQLLPDLWGRHRPGLSNMVLPLLDLYRQA